MQSQKEEFAGDLGSWIGKKFTFSSIKKQKRNTIFLEGR